MPTSACLTPPPTPTRRLSLLTSAFVSWVLVHPPTNRGSAETALLRPEEAHFGQARVRTPVLRRPRQDGLAAQLVGGKGYDAHARKARARTRTWAWAEGREVGKGSCGRRSHPAIWPVRQSDQGRRRKGAGGGRVSVEGGWRKACPACERSAGCETTEYYLPYPLLGDELTVSPGLSVYLGGSVYEGHAEKRGGEGRGGGAGTRPAPQASRLASGR